MLKKIFTFKKALFWGLIFNCATIMLVGLTVFWAYQTLNDYQLRVNRSESVVTLATQVRDSAQELLTQKLRVHFVMKRATHEDLEFAQTNFAKHSSELVRKLLELDPQMNSDKSKATKDVESAIKELSSVLAPITTGGEISTAEDWLQWDANYDYSLRRQLLPALQFLILKTQDQLTSESRLRNEVETNSTAVIFGLLLLALIYNLTSLMSLRSHLNVRLQGFEKAFSELSRGNLAHAIEYDGVDELAKLSREFNKMAESLKVAHVELEAQRATLITSSKFSALGQMAAGIAHEVNNPLAIIQGKVRSLQRALAAAQIADRAPLEANLAIINATTERIGKIIAGLKTFSRNNAKDPLTPNSIRSIVNDTIAFCGERLRNHNVELRVSEFQDIHVNCRPAQLSQVFLSLLNNSYDAIEHLPSRWIQVDILESEMGKLQIRVTDSGPKIPLEIAKNLMQPFYTTKEVGKGTGLGLSISRGIVEDHGGRLFLDLDAPHTMFVIELPLHAEQKAA